MPANFSFKLQRVLAKAKVRGGTSVSGIATELPLPNVKVEGVGRLAFPLLPDQAKKLAEAAQQAPFGRGLETVVDTSVRNTLQIDPNHVDIAPTSSWRNGFEQLVRRAVDGLGTDPAFVEAKLYKLLLYQKGGHFDFHRDTEKERGMFATLVVQLPSDFSGGEFVVRHEEVEKKHILGSDDLSCSQLSYFVAHYADCEHAVREVTGGHRLALVYSLCWKGEDGPPPTPAALSSTALGQRLANMFEEGFLANDVPIPLCIHLEHQYTESSLSHLGTRALKGRDRAIADAILATSNVLAEKDSGNELSICVASSTQVREEDCDESGYVFDVGLSNEEMNDRMKTKLNVVFEQDGTVNVGLKNLNVDWTKWVRSESFVLAEMDSDSDEAIVRMPQWRRAKRVDKDDGDSDQFDDYDSDKDHHYRYQRMTAWHETKHFKVEVTGNEGATKETTYVCCILLVWPKKGYTDVLMQCSMQRALSYVDGVGDADQAAAPLARIVKYVASHLTEAMASSCTLLLEAMVKFCQPESFCDLLEVFAAQPLLRVVHHWPYWKVKDDAGLDVYKLPVGLLNADMAMAISNAALALGLAHVQPAIEKLLAASGQRGESQLEARLILIDKLDLDLEHKTTAFEDLLTSKKSTVDKSIPKAGLRLLVSVNDADWLARFQEAVLTRPRDKKRSLLDRDELSHVIKVIGEVVAEEELQEPGRSIFRHVQQEATKIRLGRFVKSVEGSSSGEEEDGGGYFGRLFCSSWSGQQEVVREDDLTSLLQTTDADVLSRFQMAVRKWSLKKFKNLVRQVDQCVEKVQVTPEASSAVGEIKTAFIDLLQKKTLAKPEYANEISNAHYPHDANIEKFLKGPRRTKQIAVEGTSTMLRSTHRASREK